LHKACIHYGSDILSFETKIINKYIELLDILLQNIDGITLNKKSIYEATALHYACNCQNHFAIKQLLQHPQINLNIYDEFGDTPLFVTIHTSESMFHDLKKTGNLSHFKAWDLKCLRLLLNHDECLILARNFEGNRLIDLARYRLLQICNIPEHNHCESLTNDFVKIIAELEIYMAKARWKMFQYMYRSSLIRQSTSSLEKKH
jgi:hypothetical protein